MQLVIHTISPRSAIRPKLNGKKHNGKLGRIGKHIFNKLSEDDWLSEEFVEYETVEVSPEKLLEEISKQRHAIRMLYNQEIECIVIGRDFFHDAISSSPFMLNTPFHLQGVSGYKVFNVPVRFIPWFSGLLLIPKQQ